MDKVGLHRCVLWSSRPAARRALRRLPAHSGVRTDSVAFLDMTAAMRRADNRTTTWAAHLQAFDEALGQFVETTGMSRSRLRRCMAAAGLSLLDGRCYGDQLRARLRNKQNRADLAWVKRAGAQHLSRCLVRVF